jgi:hypothetical protein
VYLHPYVDAELSAEAEAAEDAAIHGAVRRAVERAVGVSAVSIVGQRDECLGGFQVGCPVTERRMRSTIRSASLELIS